MGTITDSITGRIHGKGRGWVFTPRDFLDMGARAAVDQVLSRLSKAGKIRRLGRGLYDYPKQHKQLGTLSPDADSLVQALATQTGDVVFPSGAMAANLLGLSTQVPVKPSYLSSGPSRVKKIAGRTIRFKHARIPIMQHLPDTVNYMIQALYWLGKNSIDDDVIRRCANRLTAQDIKAMSKMVTQIRLPDWLASTILKIRDDYDGRLRKAA